MWNLFDTFIRLSGKTVAQLAEHKLHVKYCWEFFENLLIGKILPTINKCLLGKKFQQGLHEEPQ